MDAILRHWLVLLVGDGFSTSVLNLMFLGMILVLAVIGYYVVRGLLVIIERIVLRTPTDWDDDLITSRLLDSISQLAPALIVSWLLPGAFDNDAQLFRWLTLLTRLYVLVMTIRIFTIFINNLYQAVASRPATTMFAVKGIFQMLKLLVIGIGVIIGLSMLIGKTPLAILTALGASAAVMMLVFKDTILGFVASIQLSANKMLEKGDWIIADRHSANGTVEEVSLTTVKVRNWDNTVTTVPPYSLVTESFINCQPMQASGGRRVARSIYIDVNTVRHLSPDEISHLASLGYVSDEDMAGVDADGRDVNLKLLRRYLVRFLENHPQLNHSMTTMVRQLDPTPSGLPLQLYFFTSTVEWVQYEMIQSDVFDHIYAVINEFGLSIFQTPAGRDFIDSPSRPEANAISR